MGTTAGGRGGTGDTRAALIAAARDLLVAEGVGAVSLRRVARACGVSAPAIYRHFADKDALVSAAAVEGFRVFSGYLLDALEEPSAGARLRRMCRRYCEFARAHPRDYQVMFMTPCDQLGLHKLDEAARRETTGTFQLLVDRIAECQAAGLLRDGEPRQLALFTWSTLHGLMSLWLSGNLEGPPPDPDPRVDQLVSFQLDAIERALASDARPVLR